MSVILFIPLPQLGAFLPTPSAYSVLLIQGYPVQFLKILPLTQAHFPFLKMPNLLLPAPFIRHLLYIYLFIQPANLARY
jgi:hypothetical protein